MLDNVKYLQELIRSVKTFSDLLGKLRSSEGSLVCFAKSTCIEKWDDIEAKLRDLFEFDNAKNKLAERCKKEAKARYDWCYGVYIIWGVKNNGNEEVIYIGKSGTVGKPKKQTFYTYKGQSVYERLGAERDNDGTSGTEWLECLIDKYICRLKVYTHLKIEVICLDIKEGNQKLDTEEGNQQNQSLPQIFAPGFIEALLIQYYLWENGRLPYENRNL